MLGDVDGPLDADALRRLDAWWRAANYLVGRPDLPDGQPAAATEPLLPEHVKPRLLGHFGTVPGLNLVYAHANRLIVERDLNAVFVAGPGHGGPGPNACAWLEGTYSELYSHITQDAEGMAAFFHQFSYPGGVPSHCAPETPGSFHEGGELGYSLLHAFGAALDSPDLTVFCVVGDGEAETGPLAASWHSRQVPQPGPRRRGAADPGPQRVQDRQPDAARPHPEPRSCATLMRGYGYEPHVVAGDDPADRAPGDGRDAMASCLDRIAEIQQAGARTARRHQSAGWPMIVLRTPKGWTCPPVVDGQQVEGTFRAHQVPLPAARTNDEHRAVLEAWLRSYRPEELFDEAGAPGARAAGPASAGRAADERQPGGQRRLAADATCGCPTGASSASRSDRPGGSEHEATRVLGGWLREVTRIEPGQLPHLRARTSWPATGCRTSSTSPAATGRSRSASSTSGSTAQGRVDRGAVASTCARACSRATC